MKITWNVNDLRQNKKKPSILDAEGAPQLEVPPSPERTPRVELSDAAEAWMLDEVPEQFPLMYRRELREMGLLDERTARTLRKLMTRGVPEL